MLDDKLKGQNTVTKSKNLSNTKNIKSIHKKTNRTVSKTVISNKSTSSVNKVNSKHKKSNKVAKDSNLKKFLKKQYLKIAIVLLALLLLFIYIQISNSKINITHDTDLSSLDAQKYAQELALIYNEQGEQERFFTEMNRIQTLVGTYLLTNTSVKPDSFEVLIKALNEEINEKEWKLLGSMRSTHYNGEYTIDYAGNVSFRFASTQIEPIWVTDARLANYIVMNKGE